jgi:hypothetical protein
LQPRSARFDYFNSERDIPGYFMAGGYKPNAGRPRGSRNLKSFVATTPKGAWVGKGKRAPLSVLLDVMADEQQEAAVRLAAAIWAAPYVHEPIGETEQLSD